MNPDRDRLCIKVCPEPGCSSVWHNIPKSHTKCNECDGNVIEINEETFWKKFSLKWFQYDFITKEYYRPVMEMISIQKDLPLLNQNVWALCMKNETESIHKIKRVPTKDTEKKWQWSGANIQSYFTLNVLKWKYETEN